MNSVSNIFIKQVSAQTYDGAKEKSLGAALLNFDSSGSTIKSVLVSTISFVLGIALLLSVTFIAVGALKYISSAGNKSKTEEAKTTLKNALIALVGIITLGSLLTLLNSIIQ